MRDVERRGVSCSLTRDGPPASLFRPEAQRGLTPDGAVVLEEVRFGTMLGGRVLGRAENAICFGRATLGADCRAGSAPRLDANPFPRFEAREEGAAAAGFKRLPPLPPPPALY